MARLLVVLPICLLLHDPLDRPQDSAPQATDRVAKAADQETISNILNKDPLVFLQMSLDRYAREAHGYTCFFCKRERVNGVLRGNEEIIVAFREKPHSVYMNWQRGATLAQKVLFVKGENDDCLLAAPAGLFSIVGVQQRSLDHPNSKNSGRYLVSEFGVKLGAERVLRDMRRAQKTGRLQVQYEGIFEVPQLDNHRCFKIVREINPAEEDGIRKAIFYFDVATWLQTGSILYDAEGNLIAEYFFKDMKFNPEFGPKQFTRAAL